MIINIVGGGPVGIVTALMCAKSGFRVNVFDEFNKKHQTDKRVLALSIASVLFLEELGLNLKNIGTPIHKIHISHNGLGVNHIHAKDLKLDALGYTVKYTDIIVQLHTEIKHYSEINHIHGHVSNITPNPNGTNTITYTDIQNNIHEIHSSLTVLSDGGVITIPDASYKEYDYNQNAIIVGIKLHDADPHLAFERFEDLGALVFLPHANHHMMIWALPNDTTNNLSQENLIDKLENLNFMKRFTGFDLIGDMVKIPLKFKRSDKPVLHQSIVLLGNSAQTLHPISAQGLNLGLRDARTLVKELTARYNKKDISCNNQHAISQALYEYQNKRTKDVKFVTNFTHYLTKFLELKNPLMKPLKSIGLIGLSNCKILQNQLTHTLIFGVCD